jgi:predicted ATPase
MVLLSGEAGIGKTRLLEELARAARQRGAAVLWGGSGAHATRLSCGPFAIALEDHVASRPEAEREELAQRYPALASLVPSLPAKGSSPPTDRAGDDLALAIVRFLGDLSRERPVLLVLGDLEDSDPFGLDLLRYLAHLAVTRRWLLIGALHDEQLSAGTGLRRVIDAMTRERVCENVRLECLSREDCDALVRATLGGNSARVDLLEEIYTRSGGNPLFIGELVRDMEDRGVRFTAGASPGACARGDAIGRGGRERASRARYGGRRRDRGHLVARHLQWRGRARSSRL